MKRSSCEKTMGDFRDQIAQHLKKLREDAVLTQVQLAKRLESTQKQISRIESGKSNFTIDFVAAWCWVCGQKVPEIIIKQ